MSWFKIFSAVLVANIVSWFIVSILGSIIFFVFVDSVSDAIDKRMNASFSQLSPAVSNQSPAAASPEKPRWLSLEEIRARQEREKRLAREEKQAQNKANRNKSAIASSKEMCDFWTEEYKKDGAPKSKGYRDMACSRYRRLLN